MRLPIASLTLAAALLSACDDGRSGASPVSTQPERSQTAPTPRAPVGTVSARGAGLEAPRRAPPPGAAAVPRLPEDPAASKRAEAQWREHLAHEETERQLQFDRRKRKEHHALVRRLSAVCARYDRARNERALNQARTYAARETIAMRAAIKRLDPWGVNSRLLSDYDAMLRALADSYPAARAAALHGDPSAQQVARHDFGQHMHSIARWLEQAEANDEDEAREQ